MRLCTFGNEFYVRCDVRVLCLAGQDMLGCCGGAGRSGAARGSPGAGWPCVAMGPVPRWPQPGVTRDRSQDTGERPIPPGNKGSSNAHG